MIRKLSFNMPFVLLSLSNGGGLVRKIRHTSVKAEAKCRITLGLKQMGGVESMPQENSPCCHDSGFLILSCVKTHVAT